MATRKSNEDGRGTERGGAGNDEHPGTYAQVVGTPRRRKSSAKQTAIEVEGSGNVERVGKAAAKYQNRLSNPPVSQEERERAERTFASPRKAGMGPLGMEQAPSEAEPTLPRQPPIAPGRESLKKTSLGMGPDMRAQLERYAAEQAETAKPIHSARPERSAAPVRVLEVDASRGHIDTEGESEADATSAFSRSDIVVASQPAPAPLAMRAPSEPPREASFPPGVIGRASTPPARNELASVFEARVSVRPSDPVQAKQSGPSWGMVVGIAVLSSIIASAGVVAMQQFLTGRSEREVPTLQVARRSAVAHPEPVVAPAPVAPPAGAVPVAAQPEVPAAPAAEVAPAEPAPVVATPEPPVATQVAPLRAKVPAGRFQPRSPVGVKPRPVAAPIAGAPHAEPAAAPAPQPARPSKPKNRLMGGLVEPGSEPTSPSPGAASEEELPDNPFAE